MMLVTAVDGPSWLVEPLSVCGLEWAAICDVQDKLAKEGIFTSSELLRMPISLFTHDYLRGLGVLSPFVRQVLIDERLQSTWLGAHLAGHNIRRECVQRCEQVMMECLGSWTGELFARVLPEELSDAYLISKGIESGVVRRCLRQMHQQVCAEQALVGKDEHAAQSSREVDPEEKQWEVCE